MENPTSLMYDLGILLVLEKHPYSLIDILIQLYWCVETLAANKVLTDFLEW